MTFFLQGRSLHSQSQNARCSSLALSQPIITLRCTAFFPKSGNAKAKTLASDRAKWFWKVFVDSRTGFRSQTSSYFACTICYDSENHLFLKVLIWKEPDSATYSDFVSGSALFDGSVFMITKRWLGSHDTEISRESKLSQLRRFLLSSQHYYPLPLTQKSGALMTASVGLFLSPLKFIVWWGFVATS